MLINKLSIIHICGHTQEWSVAEDSIAELIQKLEKRKCSDCMEKDFYPTFQVIRKQLKTTINNKNIAEGRAG